MRTVVDTNVVISGAIKSNSSPRRIIDAARRGYFVFLTSGPLIQEFGEVASRPELALKYPRLVHEKRAISEFLALHSVGNPGRLEQVVVPEDPADDRVLECAVGGKADYIVSGDRHLIALREYRGIRIVTAREFLRILRQKG